MNDWRELGGLAYKVELQNGGLCASESTLLTAAEIVLVHESGRSTVHESGQLTSGQWTRVDENEQKLVTRAGSNKSAQ